MVAKPLLAFAAFSLAMAGTAASAQSAASLSFAQSPMVRQGAGLNDASDLRGTILPVLAVIVVIGMLAFVIKGLGDDNDLPNSP
jgi:hypothetical protein